MGMKKYAIAKLSDVEGCQNVELEVRRRRIRFHRDGFPDVIFFFGGSFPIDLGSGGHPEGKGSRA